MHSAVLQNKGYIKFSSKNTVEVLSLSSLEKAIEAQDRKAATYEVEVAGKKREYFVSWPGLSLEMIQKLNQSKAKTYNDTGAIPHTSIVDPFTLKKLNGIKGGTSARNLQQMAEEAQKEIIKSHGKPEIDRGDLEDIEEAVADSDEALADEKIKKALRYLDKIEKKAKKWPDECKKPIADARKRVMDRAEKMIEEALTLAKEDPTKGKSQLRILKGKLRGTPLEERIEKEMNGIE